MKARDQVLLLYLLLGGRCLSLLTISLRQTAKKKPKPNPPFLQGTRVFEFWGFDFHPNLQSRFALVEPFVQRHQLENAWPDAFT